MQEVETRAQVVAMGADSLAGRGPTAVLPRSEIEEVIERGDDPARLVLEIARTGGESPEISADARVAVDWDRGDLEELLRTSGGTDVTLSFDEAELQRLLDEGDVEAHGMRERVAILGIVVATAGAASGSAFAHPQMSGEATGGAAPTSAPSFITDSRGGDGGAVVAPAAASFVTDSRGGDGGAVPAPEATSSFVTDSRGGDGGAVVAPAAASLVTDSRGGDGGAVPAPEATSSFVTDSRGGDGGMAPAPGATSSFVTDSRGGDGGMAPAPDSTTSFVTDSRGGDGGLAPAPDSTSFITDSRGGTGGAELAATSSGGTEISLPSAADTAGLVGLALLITGAGFVATRSRRDPHLPA